MCPLFGDSTVGGMNNPLCPIKTEEKEWQDCKPNMEYTLQCMKPH